VISIVFSGLWPDGLGVALFFDMKTITTYHILLTLETDAKRPSFQCFSPECSAGITQYPHEPAEACQPE
jgi:hypothetical protein